VLVQQEQVLQVQVLQGQVLQGQVLQGQVLLVLVPQVLVLQVQGLGFRCNLRMLKKLDLHILGLNNKHYRLHYQLDMLNCLCF
jgi:hypothetical protein